MSGSAGGPTRASPRDLTRFRLDGHGLAGAGLPGPLEAVERLLAVQAQDYAAAKWALGVRAPGSTEADVVAAINAGTIVRSWPMRGTLHFVPAPELQWMLQLTTPRLIARAKTRRAQLELDDGVALQARDVALDRLSGGGELSRAGFLAALEESGISTLGQRGYHLIGQLAQTGVLCWGRQIGSAQVLVLFDDWIPRSRRLERDEALGEFVFRYFQGHGPATIHDFAWWSGLTLADARIGLAVSRDRLTELSVAGAGHYLPAAAADGGNSGRAGPPRQRSDLLALPGFDEYLLGYRDRGHVVSDALLRRVVPGKNGIFLPILVSGGHVVGTWRKQRGASGLRAWAEPFDELTDRQLAGFDRAIRRYARFLGVPVAVAPPSTSAAD